MILVAHFQEEAASQDRRSSERHRIGPVLVSGNPSDGQIVYVTDISTSGLRLRTKAKLEIGEEILVQIPSFSVVPARLVWREGDELGCEFKTPISQAELSAFILRSPFAVPTTIDKPSIVEVPVGQGTDAEAILSFMNGLTSGSSDYSSLQLTGFRVDNDGAVIAILYEPD